MGKLRNSWKPKWKLYWERKQNDGLFCGSRTGSGRSYHGTWNASVRTGGCGNLCGFACESGTFILLQKECEIHNSAYMTLEEVLNVMEEAEKQNLRQCGFTPGNQAFTEQCASRWICWMKKVFHMRAVRESVPALERQLLLNLEYTLPEVSQSLIITRMEGRTKVPERESIESFAAHHASMSIYLSTGMLGELSRRLIAGGYGKDTPAAIVYKATWPEEEAHLCTVEQLEETAKAHNITKKR